MNIARTPRAIEGFREVSSYIAHNFGIKALREFQLRTKEWTNALKEMPKLGSVDEVKIESIGLLLYIGEA